MLWQCLRTSVLMLVVMTVLTGLVYPLAVTGLAQVAFPSQAGGSLVYEDDKPLASSLIGQPFDDPKYFWSRPSATGPFPYNAAASGGANQGPIEPALLAAVKTRVEALRAADPDNKEPVPVDLVTASSSGLDPHISPAAAQYQLARVARVRGLEPDVVSGLVSQHTASRTLGVLGESRVNVVELNLALDKLAR